MENAPVVLPMQLSTAQVRPIVYRIISKKHGLNLKSAALEVLAKFLGHHFGAEWRGDEAEKFLDEISTRWKDEDRGIFVDGPPLLQVVKDWLNAASVSQVEPNSAEGGASNFDWRQYFKLVTTRDQRRFVYDRVKKNFALAADAAAPKYFGEAQALTSVFTARYHILLDKLYRDSMFQSSGMAAVASNKCMQITEDGGVLYTISPIKNLLGRARGAEFMLFGLLVKQEDGPWTLYDPTASVPLEFTTDTAYAPEHYYTSGSFVLCHGHFLGDSFQVVTLGMPPSETRALAQHAYGNIDFYGLNTASDRRGASRMERIDPNLTQLLKDEELRLSESRIVVLGTDIFLDKLPVVDALRRALMKLNEDPPIALIIPGSFISEPFQPYMSVSDGRSAAQVYRDAMNSLADILYQCSQLSSETKIVVVPGPNDPWHSAAPAALPFQPLPQVFTGRVSRASTDIEWATNPSRLCYLSQEILLFRRDLGATLRQHSLDVDGTDNYRIGEDEDGNMEMVEAVQNLDVEDEEREADRVAVESMLEKNKYIPRSGLSDGQEFRRVVATVLDQCHLSPFAMSKAPVIWEFDQMLSLAQWPTCFMLLDPTTPTGKQEYRGCTVLNPGSFHRNEYANWIEFLPASGECRFESI